MKNILIINGHPYSGSLCSQLSKSYYEAACRITDSVTLLNVGELNFDLSLKGGYRERMVMEPDLLRAQELIKAADHLVFVYPNWWGTFPALLKGFIDRVFVPGFAFKYRENSVLWDKLLRGKTARLIVTMDSPKWYYSLMLKTPGHNAMRKGILNFCGIDPVRITTFSPVKGAEAKTIQAWIIKAGELAANDC